MKKMLARKKKQTKQEPLRSEYRFDYSQAKPNRFAAKMSEGAIAIVLEPDVAAVFKSSKTVNALLRSVISAMPQSKMSDRPATRGRCFCRQHSAQPLRTISLRNKSYLVFAEDKCSTLMFGGVASTVDA
jgi:hypothetical protein